MALYLKALAYLEFILIPHSQPHSRPAVSYYFPKGVGSYHFGVSSPRVSRIAIILNNYPQELHPMKPHRLTLTNALVMGYGLDKQIHEIFDARPATREELEVYHDADYIEYLSKYVRLCDPSSPRPIFSLPT